MAEDLNQADLLRSAMGCITAFHLGQCSDPPHASTIDLVVTALGPYRSDEVFIPVLSLALVAIRTVAAVRGIPIELAITSLAADVEEFTAYIQGSGS